MACFHPCILHGTEVEPSSNSQVAYSCAVLGDEMPPQRSPGISIPTLTRQILTCGMGLFCAPSTARNPATAKHYIPDTLFVTWVSSVPQAWWGTSATANTGLSNLSPSDWTSSQSSPYWWPIVTMQDMAWPGQGVWVAGLLPSTLLIGLGVKQILQEWFKCPMGSFVSPTVMPKADQEASEDASHFCSSPDSLALPIRKEDPCLPGVLLISRVKDASGEPQQTQSSTPPYWVFPGKKEPSIRNPLPFIEAHKGAWT